jgi:hypothetical protein
MIRSLNFEQYQGEANELLYEVMDFLGIQDRDQAGRVFRAVLHALRDRMKPSQAENLPLKSLGWRSTRNSVFPSGVRKFSFRAYNWRREKKKGKTFEEKYNSPRLVWVSITINTAYITLQLMQSRLLYKDNSIEVRYDALADIVYADWHGEQSEATILSGYKRILEMIERHSAKALLDNHSQISGLWAGASEWLANEWFKKAKSMGLQFMACVYSKHRFSYLSTMKALTLMNSEEVMGTDYLIAARLWLIDMLKK